ncbi:MAG: CpsD/CapB family tyrosine-protein kinase [Frankiaceae bacterium]|nr:CpsD/CapB family tyrosine-protein kinase [Frankiaceae bacterium]
MTLTDLLQALRRHRWIAASTFVAVLLLAAAAAFLPKDRFTATTTIVALPSADINAFAAVAQILIPTLAATAESDAVEQAVRGSYASPLSEADVILTAQPDAGTGVLQISAESPDRTVVAGYANSAAFALLTRHARGLTGVRLQVLDRAVDPTAPSGPPRIAILLGGLVLATFAGLVAALLARALAARGMLADDLPRRTGVLVFGEIPVLKGSRRRRRRQLSPTALASGKVDPRVTEALQRIRSSLDSAGRGSRPNVLAVTSLHGGEGKSSVTAALGWSLASAGYPVVVLDADLRRPRQHEIFDVAVEPGLADADRLPFATLMARTSEPSLVVVPAGLPRQHPLEVLDAALPAVLASAQAPGGLVLVDTPPLESVAETLRVLVLCKAALLVVDARKATVDEVERGLERLRRADVLVLGIVLNRAPRRRARRGQDAYYLAAKTLQATASSSVKDPKSPKTAKAVQSGAARTVVPRRG